MNKISNISDKFKASKNIKALVSLLLVAVIVTALSPGKKGFKYQFNKGKPWQYELITAPYDFPIYKTEAVIQAERDSIKENIKPVYNYDSKVGEAMISAWKVQCKEDGVPKKLSYQYLSYIETTLRKLYSRGLITNEEQDKLRSENHLEVSLIGEDNTLQDQPITRFYTLKEAYDMMFEGLPAHLDKEELTRMDLSRFLKTNINYNKELTDNLIQDELSNLSLSTGIVQSGERIIGRGEIVDSYTYNILRSLKQVYEEKSGGDTQRHVVYIGIFLLSVFILFTLWVHLVFFSPQFIGVVKNGLFLAAAILTFTVLTELVVSYGWFDLYIIPYAVMPVIMRTFFDSRTAFVSHVSCILLSSIFVSDPLQFIILQVIAGMVALSGLQRLSSRWYLIRTTFLVFVSYIIIFLCLILMRNGALDKEIWPMVLNFAINLIFLMFSYVLVYIIEKVFGYVSNISLVELSDINTPLLRQLSEEAPGTFQHSLQVSILATEAASKVGADVQLIRTGALYHDIGKMKNPMYFTENQGVINPHATLPYDESARIIIRHVTDGIALAQKYNLPDAVIDFIRTHHGRGQAKYFYTSYYNEHPDEKIDVENFTYPGPNPFSKETGILMLADAVEASSRSLKEHTEEGIKTLIDKIVDNIISEGLLNDTPLTFHDIQIIKNVFYQKLKTMYHSRITYPEKNVQPAKA
ncbi:HDIG domain-containing metalloprotein [Porphyromonas pogonae]|uniref:HD family phosphohydrolase n=1 Tax=Porphyromonas pogonae TaxID=867595 RepID=UPI002E77CC31|nr:HDIG domain-containing metalloprotein [Porphyromonas pogonae]